MLDSFKNIKEVKMGDGKGMTIDRVTRSSILRACGLCPFENEKCARCGRPRWRHEKNISDPFRATIFEERPDGSMFICTGFKSNAPADQTAVAGKVRRSDGQTSLPRNGGYCNECGQTMHVQTRILVAHKPEADHIDCMWCGVRLAIRPNAANEPRSEAE